MTSAPASSASPSASGSDRPSAVPAWVRPVLFANLVAQIGIVVTGGVVRVTGSGLGCPTWPRCVPGSFTPVPYQEQGFHKYIEFGNRLLTSVVTVTAVAALIAMIVYARRTTAHRRPLQVVGALPLVLVLAQAIIGGVSVLMGLSPITVAAHMLGSMLLVAVSTVLVVTTSVDVEPTRRTEVRWLTWAIAALSTIVIVIGTVVTGSGPHSGDAERPARFGFDPRAVSQLHADAVWLFVGLVVVLAVVARTMNTSSVLRRRAAWLVAVTLAQGLVGYVQYFTQLPAALVVTHMLGAALLVVAVTGTVMAVTGTRGLTRRDVD